jgi:hypothetical protein
LGGFQLSRPGGLAGSSSSSAAQLSTSAATGRLRAIVLRLWRMRRVTPHDLGHRAVALVSLVDVI